MNLIVKETGNINQLILEADDINTLQKMYDFKKYVNDIVKYYPEAVRLLIKILETYKKNKEIGMYTFNKEYASISEVEEFLKGE